VAGEFSELYSFLQKQGIQLFWITDGEWRKTTIYPLQAAYEKMEGNIYNISMLKDNILEKIIK
jgi:hypothetical protein